MECQDYITESDEKVISNHIITAVFEKVDVEESGLPFPDVKDSNWYHDAVEYVYGEGLWRAPAASRLRPTEP